jgi:hypothetical protein
MWQRVELKCDAIATETLSNPIGKFETEKAFQKCPKSRQGSRPLKFHIQQSLDVDYPVKGS